MAWVTGVADDYKDLLAKLVLFLTTDYSTAFPTDDFDDGSTANLTDASPSQAWTSLRYDTSSAEHELILRGPGLGGDDEIYVGIKTESSSESDWYNWVLHGFTGYEPAAAITVQPGAMAFSQGQPKILLSNGSIKYWFVANGRRIVIVAKVSTVYESAYLGLITPYGPPTSYPYPLFIGGTFSQFGEAVTSYVPRWSNISLAHNAFPWAVSFTSTGTSPTTRNAAAAAFWFAGWMPVYNRDMNNTSANYEGLKGAWTLVSPFHEAVRYTYYSNPAMSRSPGPPYGGVYPVCPAVLIKGQPGKNVFGELDGIAWAPGYGLQSEDTVTDAAYTYLVVGNAFRTGPTDYFLLKLE